MGAWFGSSVSRGMRSLLSCLSHRGAESLPAYHDIYTLCIFNEEQECCYFQ